MEGEGFFALSASPPRLRTDSGDLLFGDAYVRAPSGRSRMALPEDFAGVCGGDIVGAQDDDRPPGVTRFWGRFVAVLNDANAMRVVRDPSGAIPVFRARQSGVDLAFSDTALAFDLGLDRLTIDWSYTAGRLVDNRLLTHRSGLGGVTELEPGAWVTFGAGLPKVRPFWSLGAVAARSARDHAGMTSGDARNRLRHTLDDTVAALASEHARVAVRLSGGFDSGVVLAALAGPRGPHIACYNMATPTAEGDETAYARAMAAHVAAPFTVHRMDPARVDLRRYDVGGADAWRMRAARPPLWIANQERDDAERRCVDATGASAVFSGRGGDNTFFRCEYVWPAVDRVRALGWSRASIAYAFATAQRTGQSALGVLREAAARRTTPFPGLGVQAGLTDKARELAALLYAPSTRPALAPGKRWHVELLDDRLSYIDLAPAFDVIHPLVAQPVMEVCLETPSWLLASGTRDRGLARDAFGDRLAPALRDRRGKGRTSGYLNQVVWTNRDAISGWLEGGHLAQAQLLAPDTVRRMLRESAVGRADGEAGDLIGWCGVELWLRAAIDAGASP